MTQTENDMNTLRIELPSSWEISFEIKSITDEDGVVEDRYESTMAHEVEGAGVISGITLDRFPGYPDAYEAAIHDAQQYLDYLEQLDLPAMFIPETPEEFLGSLELSHTKYPVSYFVEQQPQDHACIIHLYTVDRSLTAVHITVYVKDWHYIDEALDFLNEHLIED